MTYNESQLCKQRMLGSFARAEAEMEVAPAPLRPATCECPVADSRFTCCVVLALRGSNRLLPRLLTEGRRLRTTRQKRRLCARLGAGLLVISMHTRCGCDVMRWSACCSSCSLTPRCAVACSSAACDADKKVGDIEPPAPGPVNEGDNFVLKVHSAQVVIDKKRVDGTPVRIAEVVVGDETGCITFRARNGQYSWPPRQWASSKRSTTVVAVGCHSNKHVGFCFAVQSKSTSCSRARTWW